MSLLVSYAFFQASLYWPIRTLAFGFLDEGSGDGPIVPPTIWAGIRSAVGYAAFSISDVFNGPPILAGEAWLRLALPGLAGFAAVLIPAILPWSAAWTLARRTWRRRNGG